MIKKIYTKCSDCGKDKFPDNTKLCYQCKKDKLIRDNDRLKQEVTLKDY